MEPAAGILLLRDPTTDVVTAVGSSVIPATSPAFTGVLTGIINHPTQDAEVQLGEHQVAPLPGGGVGGVFVGAFPIAAPTVQIIDLDDVEAVEAGAPGRGVAFLAHELQENFTAHALPAGLGSFGAAHAAGNVAEEAVAADLVGPGSELLEYLVADPAGGTSFIEDYGTYFVVVDFAPAPVPPLTSALPDNVVTGARHVPQTTLATFTVDNFATGSTVVPAAPATVAAVTALLVANPTAAVHVEGFTDEVGSAGANLALGQQRADSGRALLGAGFANRVAAIGRGETDFVVPNTNAANRATQSPHCLHRGAAVTHGSLYRIRPIQENSYPSHLPGSFRPNRLSRRQLPGRSGCLCLWNRLIPGCTTTEVPVTIVVEVEVVAPASAVPPPGVLYALQVDRYRVLHVVRGDYEPTVLFAARQAGEPFTAGTRLRLTLSSVLPSGASPLITEAEQVARFGLFYCLKFELM